MLTLINPDKMAKTTFLCTETAGRQSMPAEEQICTCKHQNLSAGNCWGLVGYNNTSPEKEKLSRQTVAA